MPALNVHVLNRIQELESIAAKWNDLWQRSEVTPPVCRVEFLRNWMDAFAPEETLRAIVVEDCERLVAAIPLVSGRLARFIPTGNLPRNEWNGAGDLLLDPAYADGSALTLLANTFDKLAWPLYRFAHVPSQSPSWRRFIQTLKHSRLRVACRPSYDVSYIDIPTSWEPYRQTWSKDHRKQMRRMFDRLQSEGEVRFQRFVPETSCEASVLLERAFAIEDASWKGQGGTSVRQSPQAAQCIRRMSELMVPARELELAFLELDGKGIAFEILWNSKRVLHSYKVSYDERFAQFSPGQLLMHELLREATERQRIDRYDCLGPISLAMRKWSRASYAVSQLTVAPRRWLGQAIFYSYERYRQISPARRDTHSEIAAADDSRQGAANQPTPLRGKLIPKISESQPNCGSRTPASPGAAQANLDEELTSV